MHPKDTSTLDLCCGGKRCPTFQDLGDKIVIRDPEQSASPIAIDKSDLPRVIAWLEQQRAITAT